MPTKKSAKSNLKFMGWRRENGRVGVRNHVVILPLDDLSNAACEAVAEACLAAGASWLNDVSALQDDPDMARAAMSGHLDRSHGRFSASLTTPSEA